MRKTNRWLVVLTAVTLVAGLATPQAQAAKLDEAEFFIEINGTDGDAGVQVFLDGEGWKRMKIFDPDGVKIVDTRNRGSVKIQGITEFFFESAEPSFDVQSLEELMALFPAGRYTFEGTTTDGELLTGKTRLTHDFPETPLQVSPVNGAAVDPDNTVLEWVPVADPPGSEIVSYEIVVETEEPELRTFKVILPPNATSLTVSPEFMNGGGDEFKWEVLAKEESGNQTIAESEFELD